MLQTLLPAVIAVVAVLLVVEVTSLRRMPPASSYPPPPALPRVSLLVPARDEEDDVGACLRSLLAQDYPDFEVLALDDGSTDGTRHVMDTVAVEDGRLRVMQGAPPPEGWLGKPWACAQLAEAASGELLVFTDADTRHSPVALRAFVATLTAEGADLLSPLTYVDDATWAERLVLPCIPWSSVTMLPLPLAYRLRAPWLAAANGQYLMFTRSGYDAAGGHAGVRGEVVEDIALARAVKRAGGTWRLTDGTALVETRMYRSLRGVFAGLGKNMFDVFGGRVAGYVLAWVLIAVAFLTPVATLLAAAFGAAQAQSVVTLALTAYALTALQFAVGFRRFGYGVALALLHPLMIAIIVLVAAWSLFAAVSGRATWKGRRVRSRVRWL